MPESQHLQRPYTDLDALAAPPVFVVGLWRSGTTWVYDILSSHPEVAGVFESGILAQDIGLGGVLAGGHWPDGAQLESRDDLFGPRARLAQLVTRDEALEELRALATRWLARAVDTQHRYLVEKTPQHVYVLPAIEELFPGAAFVHVIRDGRDVSVSSDNAALSWPGARFDKRDPEQSARLWAETIRGARAQAEERGLRYHEVRFEDLRRAPLEEARRLFEFCRIETTEEQLESIIRATDLVAVRTSDDDAFRRKGEVGGWRSQFGLRDRRRFHRGAGGLLHELGYEQDRLWWLRPSKRARP